MIINSKHSRTIYGGDIHSEFRSLIFEINRFQITDALIIILGDIGMGFYKKNYYIQEFNRMQKKLETKNNTIVFFRGNHDDPYYFENNVLEYDNIILASDYSIINQNGIKSLIVGGAISVDRTTRSSLKNEYWENEYIHFNDDDWNIIKNEKDISILLTHAAPFGKWPYEKPTLKEYIDDDIDLENDEKESRDILNDLYNDLKDNGCNITNWYYGHYHENHMEVIDDVEYRCVEMNKLYEKKNLYINV